MLGGNDYLQRRATELGLERADTLLIVQKLLDQWYPLQVRVVSLNDGVLRLVTPSAVVAGELRLRQVELRKAIGESVARLQIHIG